MWFSPEARHSRFLKALNGKKAVVLPLVFVQNAGRVDDHTFCLNANFVQDEEKYLATFDFGAELLPSFLEFFPQGLRSKAQNTLETLAAW